MSEETATQEHSPFEEHHENRSWEFGYQCGIHLGVVLVSDKSPWESDLRDHQAETALRAATGRCMVCDSPSALEFQPRLPGRSSIWLCRRDLDRFLVVHDMQFPGDDPDTSDPRTADEPMWAAGLLYGLAMSAPMIKLPRGEDGDARRAFWERLAWRVKRETCSLCPGMIHTWGGGSGISGVSLCYKCKDYLRERLLLLQWSAPGTRGPEPE